MTLTSGRQARSHAVHGIGYPLAQPLYEYRCRDCETRFERFVSGKVSRVSCPDCESKRVDRLLSVFAVSSGSKRSSQDAGAACGSCGDPRGPGACSLD